MNTALSLASDRLKVSETEQRFLRAMLSATPIAVRGETTLVPMSALLSAMEGEDCGQDAVVKAARGLMDMRKLESAEGWTSFALVDSLECVHEASFMQFRLNQTFLGFLQHVAKREGVKPF